MDHENMVKNQGPHKGGTRLFTRQIYPCQDDGKTSTHPSDLEVRGGLGFRHVFCPGGSCHLDSLIIAIDGACPGNGSSSATCSAGGIYFGDGMGLNSHGECDCDYKLNFAFSVPDHPAYPHTSQRAELHAAIGALLKARLYVEQGKQYPCGTKCATPCRVKHIVLKTDSAYLAQGITHHINKWRENGWKTATGTEVKNQDLWGCLDWLIDEYQDMGVGVDFWLVARDLNRDADRLATIGLGTSLTLTMERGFRWIHSP